MAGPEAILQVRARRAYERGRLWAALPAAALALPMTALSLLVCGRAAAPLAYGGLLLVALLAALWRGQDYARGARTGLLAGLGAFLLPLGAQCTSHVCIVGTCLLCPAVCIGGGLLAGIVVTVLVRRRVDGVTSWGYIAPALVVAGLAGSLGCLMAGTVGVLGMAGGMALGATPLLLRPSLAGR